MPSFCTCACPLGVNLLLRKSALRWCAVCMLCMLLWCRLQSAGITTSVPLHMLGHTLLLLLLLLLLLDARHELTVTFGSKYALIV